jgi:RNA polymerase sigma-70 factor (ECF subfamily)
MPDLYRVALRVLGTHQDAEDAVQNGLLAAWRNLKRFEGRSQFSTWLTRLVINAALQELRRIRAHVITSLGGESNGSSG